MTFLETMGARTGPLSTEELRTFFEKHDKNGDRRLDRDELKKAFQELGATIPQWRAWRGLKCADADGDGFVTKSEMNALVQYAYQFGYTI